MTTMGMRLTDEDVEEMIEEADSEGTGQVGVKQARKVWRCDSYLQIWNYRSLTDSLSDPSKKLWQKRFLFLPPLPLGNFLRIFFIRTELQTTSTHLLPQLAPRHSDRWKAHPASNQHQWDENFRERGLLFELTEGGSRCGGVLFDLAAAEKTPG